MDARISYDLEEILCKELEPYAKKGSLARNDLEAIFYLTGGIKNLEKINMMSEQGNSYGEEWMPIDNGSNTRIPGGRYSQSRTSYDGSYGGSYARGSGRMSRDGYSGDDMYDRMRMRMEDNRM